MQSINLISDARFTPDKATVTHAVKTDQLLIEGVYLSRGQQTGWKKIPDADRAYVCVQGAGELQVESTAAGNMLRIPLAAGAVALAPRGVFHNLVAGDSLVCSAMSTFPLRVIERG